MNVGRKEHTPEQRLWVTRNRSEARKVADKHWREGRDKMLKSRTRASIKKAQECCPTIVAGFLAYPPRTKIEMAAELHINRRTIDFWEDAYPEMFKMEFDRQVAALRAQRQVLEIIGVNQVRNLAAVGGPKAMEVLSEIMLHGEGDAKDKIRMAASKEVMAQFHQFVDVEGASRGFSEATKEFIATEVQQALPPPAEKVVESEQEESEGV